MQSDWSTQPDWLARDYDIFFPNGALRIDIMNEDIGKFGYDKKAKFTTKLLDQEP